MSDPAGITVAVNGQRVVVQIAAPNGQMCGILMSPESAETVQDGIGAALRIILEADADSRAACDVALLKAGA